MKISFLQSKSMIKLFFIFNLILFTTVSVAQDGAVNTKKNVAIQGYDAVSYFTDNKAVKGNAAIKSTVDGVVYNFSTVENKALFDKNPINYLPQYGGYCAYGVSEGHKAPIDPESFSIIDGKLYLNYNLKVKDMWSKNLEERVSNGDKNWEQINSK